MKQKEQNKMKKLSIGLLCLGLAAALAPLGFAQVKPKKVNSHAFIWDSAQGMRDLGTLGGSNSYALGISDSGVVVGYSDITGNTATHAFLWTLGRGMVDIGATAPNGDASQATTINASGNVAATLIVAGKQVPAVFSPPDHWRHLPPASGDQRNFGYGINDSNQITGQLYSGEVLSAFLWDEVSGSVTLLPALPGGNATVGNAINNLTHIAGVGNVTGGSSHAFIWSEASGIQDIGSLNGSGYTAARGINQNDEIAGLNDPEFQGFYWSAGTGMLQLQSRGGSQSAAFAINNAGNIAGWASDASGVVHAAFWSDHTSVPLDLGALHGSGNSYGQGINNSGVVVGYADAK
ncbi:MAG TPA: hypothetical protein VGG02_04300 [Chthoniobacterales bacterium]